MSAFWARNAAALADAAAQTAERGAVEAPALALVAGATSGLAGLEVAYQHYRGSYNQRIMWTPIVLSQALLAAGVWGAFDRRAARTVLPAVALVTLADGATGFVFHLRGVARKPGGWRFPVTNVVLGPPPFAPILFGMSATIALVAARLSDRSGGAAARRRRRASIRRHAAVVAGVSALCSGIESLYSHYKNNFRFKAQFSPVLVAPLLAAAAFAAARRQAGPARLLPAASALAIVDGGVGFLYHARGVLRRPGGRKHLLYNLMYGPPILAPLLFAGAGFIGLIATHLGRKERPA